MAIDDIILYNMLYIVEALYVTFHISCSVCSSRFTNRAVFHIYSICYYEVYY